MDAGRLQTVELLPNDERLIERLIPLSVRAAATHSPAWLPTPDRARKEIVRVANEAAFCRAVFEEDIPRGWVGAAPCAETAWELHPLLIDPDRHRGGFGIRLVAEAEQAAAAAGALTMFVSTSDATAATTVGGTDILADPLGALSSLEVRDPTVGHAFRFWQRLGYTVVGVLPDAEGRGVPSIHLAESLNSPTRA